MTALCAAWPQELQTVPERTDFTRTMSSMQLLEWITALKAKTDRLHVVNMFTSPMRKVAPAIVLSDQFMGYWTNFAKTGDPNGAGLPVWPAFTTARPQVMKIAPTQAIEAYPNLQQLKALDDYFAWRRAAAKTRQ